MISFITLPSTVERILLHLHLPHRPARLTPARGPQAELDPHQGPSGDRGLVQDEATPSRTLVHPLGLEPRSRRRINHPCPG
ncbi:MAG: hypothetical protein EA421_07785 [Gemmatimonadales bacterium]|nr:MAG: hypothetical protein EA421_07785 [Gemmatimonadales bacterium]